MVNIKEAVLSLFDRGFDPAKARRLPVLNEAGESNVRGTISVLPVVSVRAIAKLALM